jgi:ATP-dependent Clp protease ATP-binding subunit ClpA
MVNAVKGYLAESKVFRPEILGRIDRVYVFQPLEGMIIAEIAVLKISKLARQYGLNVQYVAPELLVRALSANEKVSRWGIRELDRILNDMLASAMVDAQESGAKAIIVEGDLSGNVSVRPA